MLGDFNMTPSSLLHAFVRGVRVYAPKATEGEWDGHEAEARGGKGKGRPQRNASRTRTHSGGDQWTASPPPWSAPMDASSSAPIHDTPPSHQDSHIDATHPLAGELLSAYGHSRCEPEATTFHKRFLGTVDFIWYTAQHLAVRTVLPTPSRRELGARRSLPDHMTPSDHVPIACDLEWRRGTTSTMPPPPRESPRARDPVAVQ